MTSSASTTQPPAAQPGPQWLTPALLVSLILFMAVISFGLLTELRGFRAEIKADLRDFQQEMKQDLRREIETAIGGVNSRTDTLRAEIKADNQQLASRMDSLDNHMDSLNDRMDRLDDRMDKLGAALNGRMDKLAGRMDQVYQLLLPAKPKP
ncbi:MAG: hypothetical protein OXC96_03800 [Cyanobacteria bacterium MAG CAR1_bin_15]|nr:hypothetical protein [Cyanobacteria bacterium MAG CAR1_bin_15]